MAGLFDNINPLSAAATGAQAVIGIGQMAAGFFQKKPKLNEYDIPPEIAQNMTDAQKMAYQGLPDAQKQQYLQNIQRSGANALAGSTTRKGGLGLVASIDQQQNDAYMNLLSADSQARMNNISMLFNARSAMAAEKEKQFQIKRENIMEKRGRIDKLRGAGLQNTMGALGSLSELASPDTKKDTSGTTAPSSGFNITTDGITKASTNNLQVGFGDNPYALRKRNN